MAVLDISPILHETLAGRYLLKREIGRGGAATVYLAHDVRHERLVAIKVLHPELSHALGAQRFLREIKLTASLQHPHILPIHDSGEANTRLYYVMPYVEGDSMRARLGADNRLSIEEAVRIGREVAGALAYAHERGVVHRDIKPENILFSGGHAVLADFGIARAIDRAHEKITQQGTITGTPAYMSPEQARDRAFDGRSDVYSLASVLYEAIAGVPPFIGDTPQLLLTQRISKTAPLLRMYRHDVPPPIESVIAKALSISPDDRFDDARAFSAALSAAIGNSGETGPARIVRRPLARSPWAWIIGVLAVVVGAMSTAKGRESLDAISGTVDTAQIAVLPLHSSGFHSSPGDEPVSQALYAALREWNGLVVANDLKVIDEVEGSRDTTFSGMMAVAHRLRSGKFIWGRVTKTRDSVRIKAGLYRAVDGSTIEERTISGPPDLVTARPDLVRSMAYDLIRPKGTERFSHSGDVGTRSLVAWRAYHDGQRALADWRVAPAMAAFERATTADPEYAHAHLWLAQLQVWRGEPPERWTPHLSKALRNRVALDTRESSLLDGLLATQQGHFLSACNAYNDIRGRDSADAVPWLGLAYCQAADNLVIPSKTSPSGFAFESSTAAAQRAYERALRVAPASFSAFPAEFVRRKLYVMESATHRRGVAADSTVYRAYPDLASDSILHIPYTERDIPGKKVAMVAPHRDQALAYNQGALLGILSALTQRLPDDADVFESLARVLETRDEITGTPNGGYSALSALDRAKALATDSAQRARLGASDVRLHLKLGDFGRTVAIGDSILAASPSAKGEVAEHLAGIALLLGREHAAIDYLRGAGSSVTLDGGPRVPLLEDVSIAFFVRAGLGACDDSLRALHVRVESLLESYVNPARRDAARSGLLQRPIGFALPCTGPSAMLALAPMRQPVLRAIQILAHGDAAHARSLLDSTQRARVVMRPGDVTIDYTLMESWLLATLGDTAEAVRKLDLTLTALPTLQPGVLTDPGLAVSVGHAMAYRAELAARTGDTGTASLWAGRLLTLWVHADPSLVPILTRMKAIAGHRS